MKRLLTFIFALHVIASFAQCPNYTKVVTDKMTGKVTRESKVPIILYTRLKEPVSINMSQSLNGEDSGSVVLFFHVKGCVDKMDAINVLYVDTTRHEFNNMTSFNCDGISMLYFSNYSSTDVQLQWLSRKKIASIRVHAHNTYYDVDLPTYQANLFYNTINCLFTLVE